MNLILLRRASVNTQIPAAIARTVNAAGPAYVEARSVGIQAFLSPEPNKESKRAKQPYAGREEGGNDGTPRAVTGSREQRESESGEKDGNEQPRRPRTWDQRCKIISHVSDLRRRFSCASSPIRPCYRSFATQCVRSQCYTKPGLI